MGNGSDDGFVLSMNAIVFYNKHQCLRYVIILPITLCTEFEILAAILNHYINIAQE